MNIGAPMAGSRRRPRRISGIGIYSGIGIDEVFGNSDSDGQSGIMAQHHLHSE
jgi:hypothetical protein